MSKPLKVLFVEDSEDDVLLMVFELRRAGFDPIFERVACETEMGLALERATWDVILCDHLLPRFGSFEALQLIKERQIDIPFIIVSGAMGEEVAVEAMRAGAHDYLIKGKLIRLAPTIEREMREALNRKERREAEHKLAYLAAIVESSDDAIIGKTLEGEILSWNSGAESMYEYSAEEMMGKSIMVLIPPHRSEEFSSIYGRIRAGEHIERYETERVRKDGKVIDVSLTLSPIKNGNGEIIGVSAIERNITAMKREEMVRIRLIGELQEALANIKTLKGLLPICAACKKIRDDHGYWQKVEHYISQHTNAEFTHGICPDCREQLYPQYSVRKAANNANG